jgi:hypothetical protein
MGEDLLLLIKAFLGNAQIMTIKNWLLHKSIDFESIMSTLKSALFTHHNIISFSILILNSDPPTHHQKNRKGKKNTY